MKDDKEPVKCEVCDEVLAGDDAEYRNGCEKCGRLFGPCCNSVDDSRCIECVE